ncbi:MAG TPA: hypothetical protein VKT28_00485 [Puia sp.]|nr:hypothetical protein [Puia sp.]
MLSYLLRNKLVFYFLCLIALFDSCNQKQTKEVVIEIQPFYNLPDSDAKFVFKQVNKIYPYVVLNKPINLPQLAYYSLRNRYRADSLLRFLSSRTLENYITIGITDQDISVTKEKITDWGIMGLGKVPGNSCIVSTFRLTPENRLNQLFKICVHELGHNEGLNHCDVDTCFMRDAEGKNVTDKERGFCMKCKSFLIKKGWNVQ